MANQSTAAPVGASLRERAEKALDNYILWEQDDALQEVTDALVRSLAESLREALASSPTPPPYPEEVVGASLRCLRRYLDTLAITSDNIGDIRRSLLSSNSSQWNGWVRDETAERENRAEPGKDRPHADTTE